MTVAKKVNEKKVEILTVDPEVAVEDVRLERISELKAKETFTKDEMIELMNLEKEVLLEAHEIEKHDLLKNQSRITDSTIIRESVVLSSGVGKGIKLIKH